MRVASLVALALSLGQSIVAQDLATSLSKYPDVSTFAGLISQVPGGVTSLLPSGITPNSTKGFTVLVPSNTAFSKFLNSSGISDITKVPIDQLVSILFYHVMYAKLKSSDFAAASDGLVVPTLLKDQKFNNRSAGAGLIHDYGADAAEGNVLYISKDPINPVKFRVRQSQSGGVSLRGGLGQGGTIQAVDGSWDLGYFQIIDVILSPPSPCSDTIRSQGTLTSLDAALDSANLWPALDHSPNVTCLAPSNNAFSAAGNPQSTLNTTDLAAALLFHTLPMPLYSPYISSGTVITSLAGLNVTVMKVDGDIYFNDAKVISPNVLTNNGLIHVLDRVMSPNGTAPVATLTATSTATATATTTGSGTGTGTTTSTAKPSNAAGPGAGGNAAGGLLAFMVAAAVLV